MHKQYRINSRLIEQTFKSYESENDALLFSLCVQVERDLLPPVEPTIKEKIEKLILLCSTLENS
jgi:hypothetical protein